jgi:hypothetical protein
MEVADCMPHLLTTWLAERRFQLLTTPLANGYTEGAHLQLRNLSSRLRYTKGFFVIPKEVLVRDVVPWQP